MSHSGRSSQVGQIAKYLNGTVSQVLVLQPSVHLTVKGYIDAAFGSHDDGKSHTGVAVKVGGATVLCMSSKQKIGTRDSTEAELVGLSTVMQCHGLCSVRDMVLKLQRDNTSTISSVTQGGGQTRTKCMRVH